MAVGPSQACKDFLELAEAHSRKWQRALSYEQEQRVHLEETIEQLAKQHNSLERAFCNTPGGPANPSKSLSEGACESEAGGRASGRASGRVSGWARSSTVLGPHKPVP